MSDAFGWPTATRNPAGLYSWDPGRCGEGLSTGENCFVGFMHNGYGSRNVQIFIRNVTAGERSLQAATAVTVAGHAGTYRRMDARRERWLVDIDGTTLEIRLRAEPNTSQADLDEAHAIIESMRTEPRDSTLGFRLVFTLTTDTWDSG